MTLQSICQSDQRTPHSKDLRHFNPNLFVTVPEDHVSKKIGFSDILTNILTILERMN